MSQHVTAAKKYRKKPVVIDAIQLHGGNEDAVLRFIYGEKYRDLAIATLPEGAPADARIAISTLEGTMYASEGDFIIKGVSGEFYPCKPDIFRMTYEEVPDA